MHNNVHLEIARRDMEERRTTDALATMVGGNHYRAGTIQPVEFMEANPQFTFCQSQIIKYAARLGAKGGIEEERKDLAKIRHYCDLHEQLVTDQRKGSDG